MNIALAHFRVGFTDGVSLEMEKWKKALESLGHQVIYIAGDAHLVDARIIPELSITSNKHKQLFHLCYESLDMMDEQALNDIILEDANRIEKPLLEVIVNEKIDLIIPNNIFSLGLHIPAALAFKQVIKQTGIEVINHHHDFYWERDRYNHPTTQSVKKYLKDLFPYHKKGISHVVINKIGQEALNQRKGIKSIVVPNVFDFEQQPFEIDTYNKDLFDKLGIENNDIVFVQATRIEDRKAIELAIDVVNQVHKDLDKYIGKTMYNQKLITKTTRIHLLMPGLNELKASKMKILQEKIDQSLVDIQLINQLIGAKRSDNQKQKTYALWDMYAIADMITYPSILEGWGNQFLEAIFAKKPLVIYEYPVFLTDIKQYHFDVVSLGHTYQKCKNGLVSVEKDRINQASQQLLEILTDQKKYSKIVNENYEKGKKHLSVKQLKNMLNTIISNNI